MDLEDLVGETDWPMKLIGLVVSAGVAVAGGMLILKGSVFGYKVEFASPQLAGWILAIVGVIGFIWSIVSFFQNGFEDDD